MNKPNRQNKDLKALEEAIMRSNGIGRTEIYGKSKKPTVTLVRKAMWTILNEKCDWTMTEIAKVFDRSHSSVSRGINSFKENKKVYRKFLKMVW